LVPAASHRWNGPVILPLRNRRIIELAGRSLREGGWVCTYADITAQYLSEQRMQGGGMCHWSLDVQSRCMQVSEHYWHMLGYPSAPPLSTQLKPWLHPDDRRALHRAMRHARRNDGSELYVDIRLLRQNGNWLWVAVYGRCILGRDGRVTAWIGAVEDIDRDRRSRKELEDARDKAQRDASYTAELFAILGHELRTPLVAIQGYLTLLEDDVQDAGMRERLAIVSAAASGLTDVLDGIGALARAEGARLPAYAPFDLHALLQECIALTAPQARDKNLRIELQMSPTARCSVIGSVMVLRQIVGNLLSNAIKFSDQGVVEVEVDLVADRVLLSVRNSGPGIAPEQQSNLFDAFVRLDRDREVPGTGLGLYVVRRLVELSEGQVRLFSEQGKGVRVTVELPWPATEGVTQAKVDPDFLSGMYILLVDDIKVNLDVTRELLVRWGGRVDIASSGALAIMRCQYEEYDLVLMDMRMPDMDGLAASRTIRQMQPHGGPLIVALTANAAQLDLRASQEAGLDGWLSKPLQLPELLRILRGGNGFASGGGVPELPSIRLARLREWLGPDACARLLPVLRDSLAEVRAQLQVLVGTDAPSELDALLHRLRGSAMNFGLQGLAEQAAAIRTHRDLLQLLVMLDEHLQLIRSWIKEGTPGEALD